MTDPRELFLINTKIIPGFNYRIQIETNTLYGVNTPVRRAERVIVRAYRHKQTGEIRFMNVLEGSQNNDYERVR